MSILTLDEAKRFLKIVDPDSGGRDAELQAMLDGITDVVEGEVGPVDVRQIEVRGVSNGRAAVLPTSNVLSVDELIDRDGNVSLSAAGLVVDGAVLRNPSGSLPGGSDLLVTVTVGMQPIPKNIKSAAREILDLAWATQRGKDRPAFLIPYRAEAFMKNSPSPLGFA